MVNKCFFICGKKCIPNLIISKGYTACPAGVRFAPTMSNVILVLLVILNCKLHQMVVHAMPLFVLRLFSGYFLCCLRCYRRSSATMLRFSSNDACKNRLQRPVTCQSVTRITRWSYETVRGASRAWSEIGNERVPESSAEKTTFCKYHL